MSERLHTKNTFRRSIYLMSVFLSLHTALYTYIHSSAAHRFIPDTTVGLLYTIASLGSLLLLSRISTLMKRFGVYAVFITGLACGFVASILLAITTDIILFIPSFLLLIIANRLLWISSDILLEHYSNEQHTGSIRGLYLTILNAAWVLGPLVAGKVGTEGDFMPIYILSALMLLPISMILRTRFNQYHDARYQHQPIILTIRTILTHKTLRPVFATAGLLNLFYSLIIIYVPLYLTDQFHFSLGTMTTMFALALLPFPILEYPLGRLIDLGVRERTVLIPGFIILSCSTVAISLVTSSSILIWTLLLVMTRIGASAIETMNEGYFFRHIKDTESNTIGAFRMIDPFAYIIGPIIASLFLLLFNMQYLFLFLGIVLVSGIGYSMLFKK